MAREKQMGQVTAGEERQRLGIVYLTQWANTNRLSPVTRLLLTERVDKNVIPTFICPQVVFT